MFVAALFRRYKLLFLLGLLILLIQVFLAYKSFTIPIDSGKSSLRERLQSIRDKQSPSSDDEDIVSNSNVQQQEAVVDKASINLLSELKFKPKCDISKDKEVISAVQRAKTQSCKEHLITVACDIKAGTHYPQKLPNSCPSGNYIESRSLGCFRDAKKRRLLGGLYSNFKETNSPKKCIQTCLQSGFVYAGVQYASECFCGNGAPDSEAKLADSSCNMKCPAEAKSACGGYFTMNIYETGIAKHTAVDSQPRAAAVSGEERVKIVFLLTLNGRALRQVYRLIKSLYSVNHFYYIHVDSRQDYLYRELLKLETMFPNVRLSRRRLATIWGGASLLEMLLTCMGELLDSDWEWDFVLNLSESDFPIKSVDKLGEFLTANRDKNFVKSHGREVQRFIQKQGLDKTFVECDTHMWRIGDRTLPEGIQIDGGSDWICLSRQFVAYVTNEERDELVAGLLKVFRHTLLPAESFFHTAIRNSPFCDTYVDNNLHITNWKRKLGCKCQYRHICDWCGCSPNDFKSEDWPRLQATEHKQLFFGRKFEPVVNQLVILQLEEWMFGPYPHGYPSLNSYWQSVYHHRDRGGGGTSNESALLLISESLIRINSKSNAIQQFYEPTRLLEITDFFELDVYKGFLVRHEARINVNLTVELETWCRPNNQHAQVSKTHRLAKKIMQLEVSTDLDPKEQMHRNFPRALGQNSELVVVVKLAGSSQGVENTTVMLTVVWIDPKDQVEEVSELTIEDITVTSINFSKSSMKRPLASGVWSVKLLEKKSLVGLTKFLIVPTASESPVTKESNSSQNQLDKSIANFYLVKDTCISYNQKNIRDIIGTYLTSDDRANSRNIIKFNECKKSPWSTQAPDPKSELLTDFGNFDGSSSS